MVATLGIDTVTGACSAAVFRRGRVAARRFALMDRGHAEAVMPMVVEVMAEAGLDYGGLDAVAVTRGPGAFTGVRIGLAAARGIGLAAAKPVLGFSTFEAVAAAIPDGQLDGRRLIVAIESKRADLYVQAFDAGRKPSGPPTAVLPEDLPNWLPDAPLAIAGDAAARALAALDGATRPEGAVTATVIDGVAQPDAAYVAQLAAELAPAFSDGAGYHPATPLYLRPPDAKRPAHGGRLRP